MTRLHKGSLFLADYAAIVRGLCEVNLQAGERFCDAVEQAIALLAQYSEAGGKAGFRHAAQVRKWVIRQFPNYLLFYEVRSDGLLLIRFLHGAQDLPPLIPES